MESTVNPKSLEVSSILVVRLDQVGDALLTIPLVRELGVAFPDAQVDLAVSHPAAIEYFSASPTPGKILRAPSESKSRFATWHSLLCLLLFWYRHLRGRRYDVVLIPRRGYCDPRYYWIAMLSRAPVVVGYRPRYGGKLAHRVLTHCLDASPGIHEVVACLDLLRPLGIEPGRVDTALEAWTTKGDESFAQKLLSAKSKPNAAIICPGSRLPQKRWPIDRFCAISKYAEERLNCTVVITGSHTEKELAKGIMQVCPAALDATWCTLGETAAIMKRCCMFIGNDTGLMHLAAAAKLPVVEVCAFPRFVQSPESPICYHPLQVEHLIVSPPTGVPPCQTICQAKVPHCILQVTESDVCSAIDELANSQGVSTP